MLCGCCVSVDSWCAMWLNTFKPLISKKVKEELDKNDHINEDIVATYSNLWLRG